MKEILLNKGMVSPVDDSDYNWLNEKRWFAKKDGKTYYAYRREYKNGKRHQIAMHREIMQTPMGLQVDHKDWNGLHNERHNLRNCTANDNCRWVRPRSNTGYLGVSKHRNISTNGTIHFSYSASIKCNGIVYNLGNDKDPVILAHAYDVKAKELFGEFANINFKPL